MRQYLSVASGVADSDAASSAASGTYYLRYLLGVLILFHCLTSEAPKLC